MHIAGLQPGQANQQLQVNNVRRAGLTAQLLADANTALVTALQSSATACLRNSCCGRVARNLLCLLGRSRACARLLQLRLAAAHYEQARVPWNGLSTPAEACHSQLPSRCARHSRSPGRGFCAHSAVLDQASASARAACSQSGARAGWLPRCPQFPASRPSPLQTVARCSFHTMRSARRSPGSPALALAVVLLLAAAAAAAAAPPPKRRPAGDRRVAAAAAAPAAAPAQAQQPGTLRRPGMNERVNGEAGERAPGLARRLGPAPAAVRDLMSPAAVPQSRPHCMVEILVLQPRQSSLASSKSARTHSPTPAAATQQPSFPK